VPTDKQQPLVTSATTPVAATPASAVPGPVGVSSYRHKLLIALCGVVLIIILSSASLLWLDWQTKHDATTQAPATTQASAVVKPSTTELSCDSDLMKYRNEDLKIGFCYPSAWGQVSMQNASTEAGDTGSRWRAVFADNPTTRIIFTGKNWVAKAPKPASCVSPAPTVSEAAFKTTWQTTKPTAGVSATQAVLGIKLEPGKQLIQESASAEAKSVCMLGHVTLTGSYASAVMTTEIPFTAAVATPDAHVATPLVLLSQQTRTDFADVVSSLATL
jgi:hypothetical protein